MTPTDPPVGIDRTDRPDHTRSSFWVPERRDEPELMDQPGLPETEVAQAYRVLRRVNVQLGNRATLLGRVRAALRDASARGLTRVRLLDVGSGSGDLVETLVGRLDGHAGVRLEGWILDRDPTAVRLASQRPNAPRVVRGDALQLPFEAGTFAIVVAVKFAHHFAGAELTRLVDEMARVAHHRVIVLDIERHWLAYWGFVLWSRGMTGNRLVRYDGPLSVLRGFTEGELLRVAEAIGTDVESGRGIHWSVQRRFPFQLLLEGTCFDR